MIELTERQQYDLKANQEYPPLVINPETRERFLLISEDLFARVRTILEDEDEIAAIREMQPLVDQAIQDENKVERDRECA